ncbi:MAG: SMC family ATPase [Erysipelotrichaceae bacterium]|nr:SMC family ATPase [Erysipelotrichaceae bacterium]
MKPVKLTMQAFSTYLDKTVIDFTALNEKGIYLISGDTGAGKTTIFDAICYALYGETSGSNRSTDVFRSSYASLDEATIVELDFMVHEIHYIVHREFSFRRSGTRRPDQDTFYYEGHLVEGKKNVNAAIRKILGVDSRQFKQIVMIAQGEFTKMLNVSSEERVRIFRNLFHTQDLQVFEDQLKKATKGYEDRYKTSMTRLNTLLAGLDMDIDTNYSEDTIATIRSQLAIKKQQVEIEEVERIARAREDDARIKHIYELRELNTAIDQYHQYIEQAKKLNEEKLHYQELEASIKRLECARELQHTEKEIITMEEDARSTRESLEEIAKEMQLNLEESAELEGKEGDLERLTFELEALRQTIAQQQEELTHQDVYFANKKRLKRIKRHLDRRYERLEIAEQSHKKLSSHVERDQQSVDRLPELRVQKHDMEVQMKAIVDRRVKLHELSDAWDSYNREIERHYELTNDYDQAKAEYQNAFSRYKGEYDLYMSQQAGILASRLQKNAPCPVCGSIHHPHLAVLTHDVMSAHDIDSLEQEAESLKTRMDEAYDALVQQTALKRELKIRITNMKRELGIIEELSKRVFIILLSDTIQQHTNDAKVYEQISDEIHYLEKLQNSLRVNKIDCQKMEENITTTRNEIITLETERATLIASNQMILDHTPEIETISQESINAKRKEADDLNREIETIRGARQELDRKHLVLTTLQQQKTEHLFDVEQSLVGKRDQFNERVIKDFESMENYDSTKRMIKLLDDKQRVLREYQQEVHTVNQLLTTLKPKVEGKEKQDLTKIQQDYDAFKADKKKKDDYASALRYGYNQAKRIVQQIEQLAKDNDKLIADYNLYFHLNQIVSGRNVHKLSFERYVLASFFEHILDYANVELQSLSQGRFQFLRRTQTKGNAGQGLDLNIIDFETGDSRDVRSLSGGESFKASLALALGLSEMIQNFAGGIELNAFFIDEGFGSLDGESLDQAIEVLMDLRRNDRVISIISHVSELKDRIESGIVVTRGAVGSEVQIIV